MVFMLFFPKIDNDTDPLKHRPVFLLRTLANCWWSGACMTGQLKVHHAGLLHGVNRFPDCERGTVTSISALSRDQTNYQQPKICHFFFFPEGYINKM